MAKKDVLLDEWQQLYEAALNVKQLQPWEWLEDVDLFGVENPEDGTVGFVSVMGILGEYLGISVYLGTEALDGFWAMQDAGPDASPEMLLELPQLQVSFTSRQDLKKADRDLIKKLGLKFRGKDAWPQFRSVFPAHMPWFLEDSEVRFLRIVLEQSFDVLKRAEDDEELLEPPEDDSYLIRVPRKDGQTIVWKDEMRQIPSSEEYEFDITLDDDLLKAFQTLPQKKLTVECDLFMVPAPVLENERPFFPYILLVVDPKDMLVLAVEMLQPVPSLKTMQATVPNVLLAQFVKAGIRPQEIAVASDLMYDLLEELTADTDVELIDAVELVGIAKVKASMFDHMADIIPEEML